MYQTRTVGCTPLSLCCFSMQRATHEPVWLKCAHDQSLMGAHRRSVVHQSLLGSPLIPQPISSHNQLAPTVGHCPLRTCNAHRHSAVPSTLLSPPRTRAVRVKALTLGPGGYRARLRPLRLTLRAQCYYYELLRAPGEHLAPITSACIRYNS